MLEERTDTACRDCDCEAQAGDAAFCINCGHAAAQHGPPRCAACGRTATNDARFCAGCGAPLDAAAAEAASAAATSSDAEAPAAAAANDDGAGQWRSVPVAQPAAAQTAPPPAPAQTAPAPARQPAQAAPPPPPPGYAYHPQPVYVQAKTNGLAIASLVLGIIWIYWIGSVLALVFGYVAKSQIDQSGGTQTGRGMAIAGIVLGWIGVAILVLALVAGASVVGGG
jgi:hypothetical protein